jgi:isoquinoline 1-oxidoreductase beta subunit
MGTRATESRSSSELIAEYKALALLPGATARNDGDVPNLFDSAADTVEATFVFQHLVHAPLEPNNCVIHWTEDAVRLLLGSQMPSTDQETAATVLGLELDKVEIVTLLSAGSFGRRGTPNGDMAAEAAHVLKAAKHKSPI